METVLRQGFRDAHERLSLIFLDILWKGIWLLATTVAFVVLAAWFGASFRALAWEDTGVPVLNTWVAAQIFREVWAALELELLTLISALLLLSVFGWLFLEAFCRSRILNRPDTKVFFVSGASKAAILGSAGIVFIPVWRGGAAIIAIVSFFALAFFLTLLDTLIRADAVELLGTDLIRVTFLVGILMLFEILVGGSFAVILIAGFLNVARLIEAMAMLGAAAVVIVLLNLFHSYLLLVRFSAVDIMRRNVVEV